MNFFLLLFCLVGISTGLFIYFNPVLAIEIQRRFYAKINWTITPVSMPKEIRNTKFMGMFLVIISALSPVYIIRR
ncbi:MAG: hypothetical protein Q8L26_07155 [Candidatus Omnitrophota bacterium]|nr:hypothetical protein [Candidatus Omnitrophota bacterium]